MIDLTINKTGLEHNHPARPRKTTSSSPPSPRCRTRSPSRRRSRSKLTTVGLWDVDPLNLFRITWHNEAKESGGLFQAVPELRRAALQRSPASPAAIVAMVGQVVPHRLPQGGRFLRLPGPPSGDRPVRRDLSPRRVALHRQLLPRRRLQLQAAGLRQSVAILPAGDEPRSALTGSMSIAGQVIATPGCESNVKEIFDKTWELKQDPSHDDLQPVRGDGQPPVALQCHRLRPGRCVRGHQEAPARPVRRRAASPPAPPAPCPPAIC